MRKSQFQCTQAKFKIPVKRSAFYLLFIIFIVLNLEIHCKFHFLTIVLEIFWSLACRLAEWVALLHMALMATVVMCRVRNPSCTAISKKGSLYKWLT